MSEVNMEYNAETGRYEGTYRVDCDRCGVKYTGIYDMPHRCKEPLITSFGTPFLPPMFEVAVVPEPEVPPAFLRKEPVDLGLTWRSVYNKLSIVKN
jgi:hypothetical protein